MLAILTDLNKIVKLLFLGTRPFRTQSTWNFVRPVPCEGWQKASLASSSCASFGRAFATLRIFVYLVASN